MSIGNRSCTYEISMNSDPSLILSGKFCIEDESFDSFIGKLNNCLNSLAERCRNVSMKSNGKFFFNSDSSMPTQPLFSGRLLDQFFQNSRIHRIDVLYYRRIAVERQEYNEVFQVTTDMFPACSCSALIVRYPSSPLNAIAFYPSFDENIRHQTEIPSEIEFALFNHDIFDIYDDKSIKKYLMSRRLKNSPILIAVALFSLKKEEESTIDRELHMINGVFEKYKDVFSIGLQTFVRWKDVRDSYHLSYR